jgi:hypothetical protein
MNDPKKSKNTKAFTNALQYVATDPKPDGIALEDVFVLETPALENDAHYFFAPCTSCQESSPIIRDPSKGKIGNPFIGKGAFRLSCALCGKEFVARPNQVFSNVWVT